ncbi:metal-dependent transcriptional regulator [Brumimicrobium oceani]|uniref:Transcriptional regulator MntR n=1 Tax=Brumimicrobium oceani TaxID=2100725 RepID=A0A2U2XGR4_9FLAO|nr:metal-dependent transcriptional regulator [Brumimicrobium oceani]PWH86930.1 iron-dependent repressor [Brumimicrobium oceani]
MDYLTQSEENYIKAIYYLQKDVEKPVGTNDLANRMETKASSVTDMVRRLSEKSLIIYEKYKGCELTELGREVALKTIRKHRLWETFLVEKLNFGWEEVHEIAEQLEHIQSVELTNRLDKFLNFPKFDPHGDPIPDRNGIIAQREETYKLIDLELDIPAVVIGVADNSASFLKYLDKHGIQLGVAVQVKDRFEFDNSTEILLNGKDLNLSAEASSKITVQVK